MEKFRPILGKIPRHFSMLTPRIFCFTGDGSSEELTWEKFLAECFIPRNFSSEVLCPLQTELFAWMDFPHLNFSNFESRHILNNAKECLHFPKFPKMSGDKFLTQPLATADGPIVTLVNMM
jgi:hypothetical protein